MKRLEVDIGLSATTDYFAPDELLTEEARHLTAMAAVYTYDGTDTILSLISGREITGHRASS